MGLTDFFKTGLSFKASELRESSEDLCNPDRGWYRMYTYDLRTEGPGRDEDLQGRPFVGASGQLLDSMIHALGMERCEVYICNIVKCRPPGNRNPEPDEAAACMDYLRQQFLLVRPKVIVLLGKIAARYVLNDETPITRMRGRWVERKGVWFMPTYHPSALLRDPSKKREAWMDFKAAKQKLSELNNHGE